MDCKNESNNTVVHEAIRCMYHTEQIKNSNKWLNRCVTILYLYYHTNIMYTVDIVKSVYVMCLNKA